MYIGCPKQKCIDNIVKWTKKDVNCLIKDVHERLQKVVTLASLIPPTIYESRDNK